MAESARVDSIDALRTLRAALLRFAEAADQATVEADMDIERTLDWVCHDQAAYWRGQLRRRTEDVGRAKRAISTKKMVPTASGLPMSTVDEEEDLALARRRVAEAERKIEAVKAWGLRIEKERTPYKTATGPIRALIERDLPKAAQELDSMLQSLEAYVELDVPSGQGAPPNDDADGAAAPPDAGDSGEDKDDEPEGQRH